MRNRPVKITPNDHYSGKKGGYEGRFQQWITLSDQDGYSEVYGIVEDDEGNIDVWQSRDIQFIRMTRT